MSLPLPQGQHLAERQWRMPDTRSQRVRIHSMQKQEEAQRSEQHGYQPS
jgi:hypothetical protein